MNGVYTGVQDVDIVTRTTDRVVGKYYVNNTANGGTEGETPASKDNDVWKEDATADPNGHWVTETRGGDETGDSYLGENAYAVFDKNNFIIGAVILGEAEGNNATKAYILDPVKYERYENGTYYWQFEAVINGEIVTQEAESKYSSTIDKMRGNQFEIVELRYNAAGDVVTDVKEIERSITAGDDKIYGYPFKEILTKTDSNPAGHKVNDNESIYDVVLTGVKTTTVDAVDYTDFTYVTRPRVDDNAEHGSATNRFNTTQLGTLRLQGRTLYVDADQHDYGIDFIRDAKAVVRQREGTLTENSWKTRAYSSVSEAIDSLGDAVKNDKDTKEFRGIITAVLNSQGVAEWVVFYSDTVAETKTNTNDPSATMKVKINVRFGTTGEAVFWDWYYAPKPDTGDLTVIPTPDAIKGVDTILEGWKVKENTGIPTVWDKKAEGKEVTFTYIEENGGGTPDTAKEVMGFEVSTLPNNNYYVVGDKLDLTGMKITVTYVDGSTQELTSGWGIGGTYANDETTVKGTPMSLAADSEKVKVTYKGKEAFFTLGDVYATTDIESIEITTNPTKMLYAVGDTFDGTGMVVKGTYGTGDNAITRVLKSADYAATPNTALNTAGNQTITVTANTDKTDTLTVKVVALEKIELINSDKIDIEYEVGDTYPTQAALNTAGVKIKATYGTGTEIVEKEIAINATGVDMKVYEADGTTENATGTATEDDKMIVFKFGGKQTSQITITVTTP